MAYNSEYTLKRGEVGTVLDFTLRDEDGPVNLNEWTVEISAQRGSDAVAIDKEACEVADNQATTGKGKGSYTFTEETADLPAGTYKLEFKATTPSGDVYYFPKSKGNAFATLTVIEPLA